MGGLPLQQKEEIGGGKGRYSKLKKKGDGRELEKTSYRQEIMKRMEGTLLIC